MENILKLFTPEECIVAPAEVGSKAFHLARLVADLDLNVPKFVVIPASACQQIAAKNFDEKDFVESIIAQIPSNKYAVRSSTTIEDTAKSAMAGQFTTVLEVGKSRLIGAIYQVIQDAYEKLGHDNGCAVIVQELIEAEVAGVIFTRNPQGGHESVIEHVNGYGEALVSGAKQPERITHYWNQPALTSPKWLVPLIEASKIIERCFARSQDIEWCWKSGKLYILQTRPITTLNKADLKMSLIIDSATPQCLFTFEQTEIAEITPRPTPVTLSLLKEIYAAGGPVDHVYRRYGVTYHDTDFLRIIGNQLYVDRGAEKASLFPKGGLSKYLLTGRNKRALRRIKIGNPKKLNEKLQAGFEKQSEFLKAYALIFEINLLTQTALGQLGAAGKLIRKPINDLLNIPALVGLEAFPTDILSHLRGNSLELADYSPLDKVVDKIKSEQPAWYRQLPGWQQDFMQKRVDTAQAFLELRERGRWYTVWLVNQLRASFNAFDPFLSLSELRSGQNYDTLERKKIWEDMNHYEFSTLISNEIVVTKNAQVGISPGLAEGRVVGLADISSVEHKAILATSLLTPDLVSLFPKISGIIAKTGGILSHLAIMAREAGIPVVGGVDRLESLIGIEVKIDGSDGTVTKTEDSKLMDG